MNQSKRQIRSIIKGSGSYLPEKILTNAQISEFVETSDEWILTRTGISKRHISADDQYTSDLAYKAALHAIENSRIDILEINLIIVATTTADSTFPSVAVKVQSLLGAYNAAAFDIQAVCAGFVHGLSVADSMIKSGHIKTALIIGAETMSRIIDWSDRSTCVLFGDGAGAIILRGEENDTQIGILDYQLFADGNCQSILYTDGGISSTQTSGFIHMNGTEVFRNAVEKMSNSVSLLMKKNNLTIDDIDFIIPHQANIRIIDAITKKLGADPNKFISTVSHHANTSAASIALAFDEKVRDGTLKSGQLIILTALGAGLSWGSILIKI